MCRKRTHELEIDIPRSLERQPELSDRSRSASISIASPGTQQPDVFNTKFGEIRSRNGALLRHVAHDAECVYELSKGGQSDLPDNMQVLLIDPTKDQVNETVRNVSHRIRSNYDNEVRLDLFFSGHGDQVEGGLILKDGVLSATDFLRLQADDVGSNRGGERSIGVWLDSCYSGAFLIQLAIKSFGDFRKFRFCEGLASCLPDEVCFEMDVLEHGVFTYTRLYSGNSHVDSANFNRAILHNDEVEIAKGLQGLVGLMSNPSAFLTKGKQFSLSLTKQFVEVHGGFGSTELGEISDYSKAIRELSRFKQAISGSK